MKYIKLINENIVSEIIPAFDPALPLIPIEQRYTAEFISTLISVNDSTEVHQNWVYNPEDQTFSEPQPPQYEESPIPEIPEATPSIIDDMDSMLIDHEYRLTILELTGDVNYE